MSEATISSKGQVTIPKAIRDVLKLKSGDRVDFALGEGGEVLLIPVTKRVDQVLGVLADKDEIVRRAEDIDKAFGNALAGKYRVKK